MRRTILAAILLSGGCFPAVAADVPPEDAAAIFKAAGFTAKDDQWRSDCDDPGEASYVPGAIERFEDLNGDVRPDAVVTEGSSFCYGNVGVSYSVVSKQKSGKWKLMAQGTGMPTFLETRGKDGWPDIEIGGPGFCFPVERWNGKAYKLSRHQYEGKACDPS